MITLVLVVALRFGEYVSALVHSPDPEVFLLRVLEAALLIAGIASQLQVSAAVGAILPGIAISGSTAANATRTLEPLRDLFAAVFFVVFGPNTAPGALPARPGLRPAAGRGHHRHEDRHGMVRRSDAGGGRLGRARAGAVLVARGEFSLVIAGPAVGSGAITGELAALSTAYVLLMAVIGPVAARLVEPVARRFVQRRSRIDRTHMPTAL